MTEYTDHLYCETYPYVTPEEVLACCKDAADLEPDSDNLLDAIEDALKMPSLKRSATVQCRIAKPQYLRFFRWCQARGYITSRVLSIAIKKALDKKGVPE